MAAYAALVSLLNTIHDITNHSRLSTSLHKKDIQPLVQNTKILLEFIEGNNIAHTTQDLERQIASAAHTAVDLIESHIVDQIHAQTSEPSLACSLDLQKTIQDMDAIIEKTTKVKEKREENSTLVAVAGPLRQSGESAMVGLDAELEKLLGDLTGYQSNWRIISIVGMGGSEDSKIDVSTIIRLWIAEGFIKPIGSRVLEEIAEDFIKDLIDRNLILGYKSYENGDIGSCGIHDLLRELCLKLAEQEGFFQMFDDKTQGIVHRVVEGVQFGRAEVALPRLRSIMTLGHVEDPTKHKLLRVVNQTVLRSEVIDYYGNFNLRYLSWVHNPNSFDYFSGEIPIYVSFMWNLQSLIITCSSSVLIVAPTEFWKMRQLRHVEFPRLFIRDPPLSNVQDGSLILDNLQTFEVIMNLRLCEEVCKIISNIKELHLDSLIESLCNLDRLHKLDSFYLEGNLEWMLLDRELHRKLINSFPRSLKKLSLRLLKLDWDDMTIVGSLPQLEVLRMWDISSYRGEQRWSPLEGQFQRLKFLRIYDCELKLWDVEESHFPVLEKLHLWFIIHGILGRDPTEYW